MNVRPLVALGIAVLAAACIPEAPPETPPPPDPPPSPTASEAARPTAPLPSATAAAEAAPLPPVELRPADDPRAPERMPRVTVLSPRGGELVRADKLPGFEVKLDVFGWPMAPGEAHVVVILDDGPPRLVTEPKATLKLAELVPGGRKPSVGHHLLFVYPARKEGVAVRPERGKSAPFAVVPFAVGEAGRRAWKPSDPMVVIGRPRGAYAGPAADDVLLDFYLFAAELGPKKQALRATVTLPGGESRTFPIASWAPQLLRNLPTGDVRVRLELLDRDGKPVTSAYAAAERSFSVARDPGR